VCCLVLLGGMKEIKKGGVLQKIMHKQRRRMKLEGPCSGEKICFKLRSRLFAGNNFFLESEFRESELFSDVWQCNGK